MAGGAFTITGEGMNGVRNGVIFSAFVKSHGVAKSKPMRRSRDLPCRSRAKASRGRLSKAGKFKE
jgi:hypothetical protein